MRELAATGIVSCKKGEGSNGDSITLTKKWVWLLGENEQEPEKQTEQEEVVAEEAATRRRDRDTEKLAERGHILILAGPRCSAGGNEKRDASTGRA